MGGTTDLLTASKLFEGFFYIQGDPLDTVYGKIDFSYGLYEDVSNIINDGITVTYKQMMDKFSTPVVLTNHTNNLNLNLIVENEPFKNSSLYNRTLINTKSDIWKRIFYIINHIYYNWNKTPELLDTELLGTDPMFYGYLPGSVNTVKRVGDVGLNMIDFRYRPNTEEEWQFVLYVNPEYFIQQFVTSDPKLYVYYDPEGDDSPDSVVNTVYNEIGPNFYDNYRKYTAPLYETGPSAPLLSFHIFTKGLIIPQNPISNAAILGAIRIKIRASEPSLSETQLITKYPTIFSTDLRVIYPLYTDNGNLKGFTIMTGNGEAVYNGMPIALHKLQNAINSSIYLKEFVNEEGTSIGLNTYEVIYLGNGRWFPIIIAGRNGALTDLIPKYQVDTSLLVDNTLENNDAKTFREFLDKSVNYILGGNVISELDKQLMGFLEDGETTRFNFKGVIWIIYKRGNQTPYNAP